VRLHYSTMQRLRHPTEVRLHYSTMQRLRHPTEVRLHYSTMQRLRLPIKVRLHYSTKQRLRHPIEMRLHMKCPYLLGFRVVRLQDLFCEILGVLFQHCRMGQEVLTFFSSSSDFILKLKLTCMMPLIGKTLQ
jgi:hypothetical protein